MNKLQLELLLNQLYDCSLAIYDAIQNEDLNELNNLIEAKAEKMKLVDKNKKFLTCSFSLFDVMVEQIKKQEVINLQLLEEKKNIFYKKYRQTIKTSKILNKYTPAIAPKGAIVDTAE